MLNAAVTTLETWFHDSQDFEDAYFVADRNCANEGDRRFLSELNRLYLHHGLKCPMTEQTYQRLITIALNPEKGGDPQQ